MKLFPYPLFIGGKRYSGSIQEWPDRCVDCRTEDCRKDRRTELSICPRGLHFLRLDAGTTIAGLVVKNVSVTTEAQCKIRKRYHSLFITKEQLERARDSWNKATIENEKIIKETAAVLLDGYLESEIWKTDYLKQFQSEIQKGLSFVHDYKQINQQLAQQINVIIETKYLGKSFEEKLRACSKEERSIYEASKYLDEKLKATKYLLHPEKLLIPESCSTFRFHAIVHTYTMLYTPRFASKGVKVAEAGESYNSINAIPDAVAVIPHTLIDNAAKYSPRDSTMEIVAQDVDGGIRFEISSFGPKIENEERVKIFHPFFRGARAQEVEEEGAGYGLYVAQLVAKSHLGCEIEVSQSENATGGKGYWTTFRVVLPLRAIVARKSR